MNTTKKKRISKYVRPTEPRPDFKVECWLERACEKTGTSIYELAYKLGRHPNQLYPYTKGSMPNIGIALTIADALNVDVNDIWKLIK